MEKAKAARRKRAAPMTSVNFSVYGWLHLAVVVKKNVPRIYINGTLVPNWGDA